MPISLVSLLVIGTVLAIVTLLLAGMDLAAESWANPMDHKVSKFVIQRRTVNETKAMRFFSWLGGPFGIFMLMLLVCVWAYYWHHIPTAKLFVLVMGASAAYVLSLKLLTARKRPTYKVLERERTYSFPSAHTLLSTVAYGSAVALSYRVGSVQENPWPLVVLLCLLVSIAASRIYLGCHYLSDVIAGIIGGGVWVGIFMYLSGF